MIEDPEQLWNEGVEKAGMSDFQEFLVPIERYKCKLLDFNQKL